MGNADRQLLLLDSSEFLEKPRQPLVTIIVMDAQQAEGGAIIVFDIAVFVVMLLFIVSLMFLSSTHGTVSLNQFGDTWE